MDAGDQKISGQAFRFNRYVEYAVAILNAYNGTTPFHSYLKKYFAANRRHGSKDRKRISALCYNFFRLGNGVTQDTGTSEKVVFSAFLLENDNLLRPSFLDAEWSETPSEFLSGKLAAAKEWFDVNKIFPFPEALSKEINIASFNKSFLIQPKLFIRIRPGFEKSVFQKLQESGINFERIEKNTVSFTNTEKINHWLQTDREVVIQDYNSQRTLDVLIKHLNKAGNIALWDCCAASGGKSLLAYDRLPKIAITVSDTRAKILENLHFRFTQAGIRDYHSFVADLSKDDAVAALKNHFFDVVMADVPCSGSGTWARTPEQLHFFQESSIEKYALLQQQIVTNAVRYLSQDGYLLYITCSVFSKENEENVDFFERNLSLEFIESTYLKGFEMQADTLFVALFKNKAD
jgi:16S rRNA (cytosine967-C5)-methyltransferase